MGSQREGIDDRMCFMGKMLVYRVELSHAMIRLGKDSENSDEVRLKQVAL